jgi:YjbE family integral membrane protein
MPLIGWSDLGQMAFWVAALKIIWLNVVLSANNLVLIAMACRGLPPSRRLLGMTLGVGSAILFCIVFAEIITWLMVLPYVKLISGLALLYIAVKLLVQQEAERGEVEPAAHFWRVVRLVTISNIIVSLDNVIATALAAQGDFALLVIGLGVTVPATIAGAAVIGQLLDRFPVLLWLGTLLLGWVAGDAIVSDAAVESYLAARLNVAEVQGVALAAAPICAALALGLGASLRRVRRSRLPKGQLDPRQRSIVGRAIDDAPASSTRHQERA